MIIAWLIASLQITVALLAAPSSAIAKDNSRAAQHRREGSGFEQADHTDVDPLLGAPNEYDDHYSSSLGINAKPGDDGNAKVAASRSRASGPNSMTRYDTYASDYKGHRGSNIALNPQDEEDSLGVSAATRHAGAARGKTAGSANARRQSTTPSPYAAGFGGYENRRQPAISSPTTIYRSPW